MAIQCPNCASQNPDQSAFCVRCGQTLSQQNGPANYGYGYNPSAPFAQAAFPASASQPITPSGMTAAPPMGMQSGVAPTPPMGMQTGTPVVAQMGTQGTIAHRRAFAGHGTPVMHYSWLLNGKQVQAAMLTSVIVQRLLQRNVTGLTVTQEKLTERGLMTETRDYMKVVRGVSTVFVYVAPAGQDLYISRATSVQPTISNARAVLLILLVLMAFFPSLIGGLIGGLLAVFVAPIYLILALILGRAIMNWIVEKDFWMILRPNVLNDFQIDDIALMEHVTDEIVHDAVKELGLDASKIAPPTQGYRPQRKIRAF